MICTVTLCVCVCVHLVHTTTTFKNELSRVQLYVLCNWYLNRLHIVSLALKRQDFRLCTCACCFATFSSLCTLIYDLFWVNLSRPITTRTLDDQCRG